MDSELIDNPGLIDEFDSAEEKNHQNRVRIISGILFLLILSLSPFCYKEIVQLIAYYCKLRNKWISGFDIHGMVSSFFLSSIPVIAYNVWLKSTRRITILGYLVFFVCTVLLYVVLFVLGIEGIFALSHKATDENSLLPSYVLFPPNSSAFDLLFIGSSLLSFLILKWIVRKKRKKSTD